MASVDDIKKIRKRLEKAKDDKDGTVILSTLQTLFIQKMTLELIKDSKIGKVVGKLRKYDDEKISKLATELVGAWKKICDLVPSTAPSPPISPANHSSSSNSPPASVTNNTNNGNGNGKADDKKRKKDDEQQDKPKNNGKKKQKKADSDDDDKVLNKTPNNSKTSVPKSADDPLRTRIVELLKASFGTAKEQDALDIAQVCEEIETELLKIYGSVNKEYKAKYRSLSFNIKNNQAFRDTIMCGVITAEKLCTMSVQEMASDELKKERERIVKYHLEAAKLRNNASASTNMFKCGKCGKRECTYYQLQTRSADEPMTSFITCTSCGNRWKQ